MKKLYISHIQASLYVSMSLIWQRKENVDIKDSLGGLYLPVLCNYDSYSLFVIFRFQFCWLKDSGPMFVFFLFFCFCFLSEASILGITPKRKLSPLSTQNKHHRQISNTQVQISSSPTIGMKDLHPESISNRYQQKLPKNCPIPQFLHPHSSVIFIKIIYSIPSKRPR